MGWGVGVSRGSVESGEYKLQKAGRGDWFM